MVGGSIIDYFSYDTITTAMTVYEMPALFTTVSSCSQNMFTTQAGYEFVRNYTSTNVFLETSDWMDQSFLNDNDLIKYGLGVKLFDPFEYTNEFRRRMGLSIKDMILSCYFNNFYCSSDDLFWYFDPYYG